MSSHALSISIFENSDFKKREDEDVHIDIDIEM